MEKSVFTNVSLVDGVWLDSVCCPTISTEKLPRDLTIINL